MDADLEYIQADLNDPHFVNNLPSKIDAVLHLAQSEDYRAFPKLASNVFRVNVTSVASLLEWAQAAGATHFVQASTGGIYGFGPRPFKETDFIDIVGRLAYYYSTKYAAEIIASAYRECLTIVSLRYFFIYGAGQKSSMLLPRLIDAIGNGHPLTLAGEAGMRLNPIHVTDAAAATLSALKLETSKCVNVAGPEAVSMRELGQIIGAELGKPVFFDQRSSVDGQDLVGDVSLMRSCLGVPRIGMREGIALMCSGVSVA